MFPVEVFVTVNVKQLFQKTTTTKKPLYLYRVDTGNAIPFLTTFTERTVNTLLKGIK